MEVAPEEYIHALIELHRGLDRQGPGDPDFTSFIIEQLPELPSRPRIADLGCGAGAGALALAAAYRAPIRAVDFARPFLDQMMARARENGLDTFIEPIEADFGELGWEPGGIDLLWSEGAAYNITFDGALAQWKPLLAASGIAVITEMNYFSSEAPPALQTFMQDAYPQIRTEAENVEAIAAAGFEVLGVHRLPAAAWWQNYYGPLREKIETLASSAEPAMRAVIADTRAEMQMFETYSSDYGYTCFIMRRA